MAFLIETDGGQIGYYDCKCGKGGVAVTVEQEPGRPPHGFHITITHGRKEDTVRLSVWEFAQMIMDVTPAFYGSLN